MADCTVIPKKPSTPGYNAVWHKRGGWRIRLRDRGVTRDVYLGKDTAKAESKFRDVIENLKVGADPTGKRLRLVDLCVAFLEFQKGRADVDEIGPRSYQKFCDGIRILTDHIPPQVFVGDLEPRDFDAFRNHLLGKYAANTSNDVMRIATRVFRFAYDRGLVEVPVRYGDSLRGASKRVRERDQLARGRDYLLPGEINRLVDNLTPMWSAAVVLGYFAGFGGNDVSTLTFDELDLVEGWVEKRRNKTNETGRAWLPPWARENIANYLKVRPRPTAKSARDLVFINKERRPYDTGTSNFSRIAVRTFKRRAEIHPPLTFYSLRRSTATFGTEYGDDVAVVRLMRHKDSRMTARYVKTFPDDRLEAVGRYLDQTLADARGEEVAK